MHPPLIITGLHRSGTTWIGKIIEETGQVSVLHEPMNLQHGLRGIPCWYPYHPGGHPTPEAAPYADQVEQLFSEFFKGSARYVRSHPKAPLHRKLARALFGSNMERSYRAAIKAQSTRPVCLKDPFCLFLLPHLIERYNARVAITVRHPGALLVSMRRMKWTPHLSTLQSQPDLMRLYGDTEADALAAKSPLHDEIHQHSLFWKIAYKLSRHLKERYPENVCLIRHEDLSHGSEPALDTLLDHFRIGEGREQALAFVKNSTSGKVVAPKSGVLHEFSRDGSRITSYWKEKLSREEQTLLVSMAGPELDHHYQDT